MRFFGEGVTVISHGEMAVKMNTKQFDTVSRLQNAVSEVELKINRNFHSRRFKDDHVHFGCIDYYLFFL